MTREEAICKIKELEEYIKSLEENIGFENDELFLLSIEEYERYKDNIPLIKIWWWLRSPGDNRGSAALVDEVGSVLDYGSRVSYDYGVRPALRYSNLESEIVKSVTNPKRILYKDFPFIIIDGENKIAISEVPISFEIFDEKSNDYKKSEIRRYLESFQKAGAKNDN